jgi:AmmeMemoRadiSam system protein A
MEGMDFVITNITNITNEEKTALLAGAREAIAAQLEQREPRYGKKPAAAGAASALSEPCGAFVTLRKKGALRGCIGRMSAQGALEQTVRAMAKEAAFGDPRFPPLRAGELDECRIEISALSPMVKCADPWSIEVGVHGIYLRYRGRSGVLLPQVPVEQGWDKRQYLDYICIKAGVPPKSYEEKDAEFFTFTAVVFGED